MDVINKIMHMIFIFEKEPQKVGLSQLRTNSVNSEPVGPSLKRKDVKLSDLMRRASWYNLFYSKYIKNSLLQIYLDSIKIYV